jgi:hypothetical protein
MGTGVVVVLLGVGDAVGVLLGLGDLLGLGVLVGVGVLVCVCVLVGVTVTVGVGVGVGFTSTSIHAADRKIVRMKTIKSFDRIAAPPPLKNRMWHRAHEQSLTSFKLDSTLEHMESGNAGTANLPIY